MYFVVCRLNPKIDVFAADVVGAAVTVVTAVACAGN